MSSSRTEVGERKAADLKVTSGAVTQRCNGQFLSAIFLGPEKMTFIWGEEEALSDLACDFPFGGSIVPGRPQLPFSCGLPPVMANVLGVYTWVLTHGTHPYTPICAHKVDAHGGGARQNHLPLVRQARLLFRVSLLYYSYQMSQALTTTPSFHT